jgi:hypothetical protein
MKSKSLVLFGFLAVGAVAVSLSDARVHAGRAVAVTPTFNEHVAPILYKNCVACHREDSAAPMSLISYKEARPWARAIKRKVSLKEMPPWFADPRYGEFRNTRGLSEDEIKTLVAWADAGAPEGKGAAPKAPPLADGWMHPSGRPPDMVIEMTNDFKVPAQGELPNFSLYQELNIPGDLFLEAIQLKPSNWAAMHHSSVGIRDLPRGTKLGRGEAWPGGPISDGVPVSIDGKTKVDNRGDRTEAEAAAAATAATTAARDVAAADVFAVAGTSHLVFYVPGGGFEQWHDGVGKRIRKGQYLVWGLHYTPTGRPETDRSLVGLWLHKQQTTHEVLTRRVGETHIAEMQELVKTERDREPLPGQSGRMEGAPPIPNIPPNAHNWKLTGITAFRDDVTLYLAWPHMHLRGKDMTFVVTYPDGREEIVLNVPKYDFNWQLQYEYAKPIKIPAGGTIKTIGHYDNTRSNRYNPSPDKEVYWAEQSWDEMFNGWIDYSVDKLDLRLEKKLPVTQESRKE